MTAEPASPGDGAWAGGWHRMARRCPSPNFGQRPPAVVVDLVVVHSISLPPGEYGGDAVERFFCNRLDMQAHPWFCNIQGVQVSAHFFIRRTGEVIQFVNCHDRAWHAGASSWRGRGDCNDYSVGIELEGLEDQPFGAAQYPALAMLCRDLAQLLPIRDVVGHEHIAAGRKRDPGPGFDWQRLRQQPGWPRHLETAVGQVGR